ncbi:MAG TPA: hypothetical protein VKT81_21495 [Bryobacteraceae bacterium]|nr:hypothetical protein [Bryobacteraceae bacterium]
MSNGIRIRVTANTGGNSPDTLKVDMKPASGNSMYRLLRDDSGLAVWAYELVVDRLPDGDHFQIIAKPAGAEFAQKFPNADGGKPTPTFSIPIESPPLGAGGRFVIDIPTNPGLFEHRTDTVQVQPDPRGDGRLQNSAAQPQIRFADLRVSIKGAPVLNNGGGAMVYGPFAMFYIPTRGGYFFSTQPVTSRPFVQIATVERNKLKFTIDNEDFECTSATPILTQSERGQIWVYHDPRYKPEGTWTKSNPKSKDEFFTGAADSLDWWLP